MYHVFHPTWLNFYTPFYLRRSILSVLRRHQSSAKFGVVMIQFHYYWSIRNIFGCFNWRLWWSELIIRLIYRISLSTISIYKILVCFVHNLFTVPWEPRNEVTFQKISLSPLKVITFLKFETNFSSVRLSFIGNYFISYLLFP